MNRVDVCGLYIVSDILSYSDRISTNTGLSAGVGQHHNNSTQLYLLKLLPPFINNSKRISFLLFHHTV